MSEFIRIRDMLNEAIDLWGLEDIVTRMLSQRLDREINEIQKLKYEKYKKGA